MSPNKTYTVTKKIKLHTKPLVQAVISMTGLFEKETTSYYVFRGFKVRKSTIVSIKAK